MQEINDRLKRKLGSNFNNIASYYNKHSFVQNNISLYLYQRFLYKKIKKIKSVNQNKLSLLEIGSGTGFLFRILISSKLIKYFNKILFVDKSKNMCNILSRQINNHKNISCNLKNKQIKIISSSLEKLVCNDNKYNFNIAFSSMTLHWTDNLVLSIQKIKKHSDDILLLMPTQSSFHEVKNILTTEEQNQIFMNLPEIVQIKNIAIQNNLCVYFVKKQYKYSNIIDFFKSIKYSGGDFNSINLKQQNTKSAILLKLLKHKEFQNLKEVTITWHFAIIVSR